MPDESSRNYREHGPETIETKERLKKPKKDSD
jgi:hypothetical protein